ncbi:MAG: NAD-dependent epimerase/dehydratase family protein [Inquilinaceae bacterium]
MARILITGAAGGIGSRLRPLLADGYAERRLSDRVPITDLAPGESFAAADLMDLAQVEAACEGVDGIVHLGGQSNEAPWQTVLEANIIGCYNLFEAARRQGVRRVVFASSNHAIGFHRRSRRIGVDAPLRPDSRYGVSKAFGESLGSLYADKYGLGVLCIRIGNVADKPADVRRLAIWISPEDLAGLVRIGLDRPDLHFEIVYGASDNDRGWWDNAPAYRMGYNPTGRSEDHLDHALAAQEKLPADPVGDVFQGGGFCSAEFVGDPDRVP